jgi:4'-phosphopantetheinyl transferase
VRRAANAPDGLGATQVHVWDGTLEHPAPVISALEQLLSGDERERAARFRFERDRSRYVAGRAQLRRLLARYLDMAPRAITFEYGRFGKPQLPGRPLAFNLAHSGARMLVALTRDLDVGVDVELYDPDLARERVAEHFSSSAEVATLRGLAPERQPAAFLACWTRKEAFIKARGDGLQLALDSFDVTLAPGQPAALVRTAWSSSEPRKWCLIDLSDVPGGYVAAVAVRSPTPVEVVRRSLPQIEQSTVNQEV